MSIKRPTERNTKPEILSAFDELLRQNKTLETQLAQATAVPVPAADPVEARNGQSSRPVETAAPPAAAQKMETILADLNRLQLNFGGAISDLSEKLVLEATRLQEVRQSVSQELEQLEALHQLQATDGSLDTLIEEYEASAKTFTDELRQRQEAIAQQQTQTQKAWSKEQEDYRRRLKERNETASKTRQRDAREYSYALELQRKLSNDEYEQEQKQLYQELKNQQQIQEKNWNEREQAIAQRETQFAELKTQVEAMPQQLETAIKRAREEGKGIAQHQAKVKADLLAKEVEGRRKTYELRLNFLEGTISEQQTRIQSLAKQLEAALKQVQDLAVKAIEGASDISSFEAVREIALEQAKNQNKAK